MHFLKYKSIPLIQLYSHVLKGRKKTIAWLVFLMIVTSFSEIISIGLLIPFLYLLTGKYNSDVFLKKLPFIENFLTENNIDLIFFITIFFIVAVVVSAYIRIKLIHESLTFSYSMSTKLSDEIYSRVLNSPYFFHLTNNSSKLINIISNKVNGISGGILMPSIIILSSSLMGFFIIIALALINWIVTFSTFSVFAGFYIFLSIYNKKKIEKYSKTISYESDQVYKYLNEGIGSIRDIILDNSQNYYFKLYSDSNQKLQISYVNSSLISQAPRYILECIGIIFISSLAYYLTYKKFENGSLVIATLGAVALGAQRLLPMMQQLFSAVVSIRVNSSNLDDILNILRAPSENISDNFCINKFEKFIELKNISFAYAGSNKLILKDVNLKIKKGCKYGIVGITGSGKSTLLDLLMGLVEPTSGSILLDGNKALSLMNKSWRTQIAHVPQTIYLLDSTIEQNIVLGVPKNLINKERLKLVSSVAQLDRFIEESKDGYDTIVGERGVRLSGGQRQRIGIARALYKGASILILDEATSALDEHTECTIMEAIDCFSEGMTVIMATHRISTLQKCNQVFRIQEGYVV